MTHLTVKQMLEQGRSAEFQLKRAYGYDQADFTSIHIRDNGEVVYYFDLMDDFQKDMDYKDRYECGWNTGIDADETGNVLNQLFRRKTRPQRERAIMARRIAALGESLEKFTSADLREFGEKLTQEYRDFLLEDHSGAAPVVLDEPDEIIPQSAGLEADFDSDETPF